MKDCGGSDLKVHDSVLFIYNGHGGNYLREGVISKLTPKGALICYRQLDKEGNCTEREIQVKGTRIAKVLSKEGDFCELCGGGMALSRHND